MSQWDKCEQGTGVSSTKVSDLHIMYLGACAHG